MVDFRRYLLVLAILALFTGFAYGQAGQVAGNGSTGSLQCTAAAAVTPSLRSEGYTEEIGDITLTCTGGQALAAGSLIPTANITVFLNTQVTSRLIPNTTLVNASEALLLVNEPGANLGGYGPAQSQNFCGAANVQVGAGAGGCQEWVANGVVYQDRVAGSQTANGTMSSSAGGVSTAPANVFQGVVNGTTSSGNVTGNSVTFNGIPVLAPVSSGVLLIYRITNVRINATALGGGPGTFTPAIASISISGSTSVPITNASLTTGFVQVSLATKLTSATNGTIGSNGASFNQCQSQTIVGAGLLNYTELTGNAFKTRVFPLTNTAGAGQSQNLTPTVYTASSQSQPGTIYNAESGFIYPPVTASGEVAGLSDYGTRLKAVFNNVPTGVTVWVSVTNVINSAVTPVVPPSVIGGTSNTIFAQLVPSETISDGTGFFPVTGTNVPNGNLGPTGYNYVVALTAGASGSVTAVWEVTNDNPSLDETVQFGYYLTYTAAVTSNSPSPGVMTVNMSYAPTPTQGAFAVAAGPVASSAPIIPRFADTSAAGNAAAVNICRTILLFPYVINIAGFDTGLAIANTSQDPFGTKLQSGTCTLYWYGVSPPPNTVTGVVTTAAEYTTLASVTAPNFAGYMIAICNFQYAHGFAFVSDLGARNLAMGYLALIIPDPATTTAGRPAAAPVPASNAEMLDN